MGEGRADKKTNTWQQRAEAILCRGAASIKEIHKE
jgi:hypothetical protein